MYSSLLLAASLATAAHAFTQPGAQTWGPLLTPDTSDPVTQGKDYTVTWDPESHPTDGVTVSLVLCHGPGSNCVLSDTAIAEGIPAGQKSYDWSVPCDLAPGTQSTSTGYGMLIIVDGTGEFQYSTQFSVLANSDCASSGSTSSSSVSSSASASLTTSTVSGHSSIIIGPPAYQTGTSSVWGSAGNWSTTATSTGSNWVSFPGTTVIVSTSGSVVVTYGGATYTTAGTSTAGSTLTTAAASTTGVAATASGPAAGASTFAGGAGQLGSSIAGMVIAGAVAVFAL